MVRYNKKRKSGGRNKDTGLAAVTAGAGILLVLILAVAIGIFINNSKKQREEVEAEIAAWEELESPQEAGEEDGVENSPDEQDSSLKEEDTQDPQQTGEGRSEEETKEKQEDQAVQESAKEPGAAVGVGALDDAQDPQSSGAAGNEQAGAAVTVSGLDRDETESLSMGIDVSKYQGTIDWAKVRQSGVEFAMIRVGYRAKSTGEILEDPTARYNMQEAQAAGIKIGAYFFSSAVSREEAKEEAAFTKDIIAKYRITYPVAYNCEDFQSPDSRQYGLDAGR